MNFGQAIEEIKKGVQMRRKAWRGSDVLVGLCRPRTYEEMSAPFLYIAPWDGGREPWSPAHVDLLAEDWEIAP